VVLSAWLKSCGAGNARGILYHADMSGPTTAQQIFAPVLMLVHLAFVVCCIYVSGVMLCDLRRYRGAWGWSAMKRLPQPARRIYATATCIWLGAWLMMILLAFVG
jgi:hypothetical protein